jgi:DNA primase
MPGIHFASVRARIALTDVLAVIGFVPCESYGDQVRGPCPVHHSATPSSRSFSANLRLNIYKCFKCGSGGNQLDLYATVTGLSVFEAAIELCEKLDHEIPWMVKDTPISPRAAERPAP